MTLMRILLAVLAGVFSAISIDQLHKRETAFPQTLPGYREGKDLRREPFYKNGWMWAAVLMSGVLLLASKTRAYYARLLWVVLSEYLLVLSAYCILLLVLTPLLRRTISARVCGRFWELPAVVVSCIFYFEIMQNTAFVRLPKLILYVPQTVLTVLTAVWLIGFTATLIWNISSHFRFKKQVICNEREADVETQNLWRSVIHAVGLNWNIPLYVAPDIHTPLVLGIRKRTMKAFLPDKYYTRDELRMIFHHELRHVFRRDGEIKLAWIIIRSLLWFNPFAWLAEQRAAEDLELSCDAFVLEGADESIRRHYAELLLDTAGDSRGFSTCLSSSARTLRYRLKCVVKPGKRLKGALALGLAAFVLMMSVGTVSFAHQRGKLSGFYDFSRYTEITDSFSHPITGTALGFAGISNESYFGKRDDRDVIDYLSNLEVLALTKPIKSVSFSPGEGGPFGDGQWAGFQLYDPQAEVVLWIHLWEDWLVVQTYSPYNTQYYKVPGGIDWEWLNTMLGPAEG